MPSIALIGDYSAAVTAHRAIPLALEAVQREGLSQLSWEWIPTRELRSPARDLANFDGLWAVPASPYENPDGVIAAIQWARENKRPFLGTCGGFQHALIEFARNVLKISAADHAETAPAAAAD